MRCPVDKYKTWRQFAPSLIVGFMKWTGAMAAAGIGVRAESARSVLLSNEDGTTRQFQLTMRARPPRPSEVGPAPGPDCLLIAPSISPAAAARLATEGWSWATDTGQLHIAFGEGHDVAVAWPTNPDVDSPHLDEDTPLRVRGVGAYALLRRMIVSGGDPAPAVTTQARLSDLTALSQPRVSQLMRALCEANIVTGARASWRVTSPESALEVFLAGYPGPGGVTTHWAGTGEMWESTKAALDRLPQDTAVSGDAGADLLASYRRPTRAVLYSRSATDLSEAGLVPVTDVADASVSLTVPADGTVWPETPLLRCFEARTLCIADPIQVLWDVNQTLTLDSDQASKRLHGWIRGYLRHPPEPVG
jgi:hypothetical protein